MRTQFLAFAIVGCFAAGSAQGALLSYTDEMPLSPTSASAVLNFPKFDPTLGSLEAVDVVLTGHIEGTMKFESRDPMPTTVEMRLAANIQLKNPENNVVAVTVPLVDIFSDVAPYDGVLDFSGSSGRTFSGLSATETAPPITLTATPDLLKYIGSGTIDLPVVAAAASFGRGSGNIVYLFNTFASASVLVNYRYQAAPEPGTLALLGLGFVSFVLRRR